MGKIDLIYMSAELVKKLISAQFEFAPDDAVTVVKGENGTEMMLTSAIGRSYVVKVEVFVAFCLNPFGHPSMERYWNQGEWTELAMQLERRAVTTRVMPTDIQPVPSTEGDDNTELLEQYWCIYKNGQVTGYGFGSIHSAKELCEIQNQMFGDYVYGFSRWKNILSPPIGRIFNLVDEIAEFENGLSIISD